MTETLELKTFRQEYTEPLFKQWCKDNPGADFTLAVDEIWRLRKAAEDLYAQRLNKTTSGA